MKYYQHNYVNVHNNVSPLMGKTHVYNKHDWNLTNLLIAITRKITACYHIRQSSRLFRSDQTDENTKTLEGLTFHG